MNKKDLTLGSVIALLVALLSYPTIVNVLTDISNTTAWLISLTLGFLTILGLVTLKFLSRWIGVLWQFAKFAVIGGLNTFLDFAVLNLLINYSGIAQGLPFSGFKGIAFTIAVVNSYFWNKYWTFSDGQAERKTQFIEFIVVSLIGLGVNVGVASFIVNSVEPIGGLSPEVWANVGALFATAFAWLWNFLGYKFIVFKAKS